VTPRALEATILAWIWRAALMGMTAVLATLGAGAGVTGVRGDAVVAAREVPVSMLPSLPTMTMAPPRPLLFCR
jgi:hypothetical protein